MDDDMLFDEMSESLTTSPCSVNDNEDDLVDALCYTPMSALTSTIASSTGQIINTEFPRVWQLEQREQLQPRHRECYSPFAELSADAHEPSFPIYEHYGVQEADSFDVVSLEQQLNLLPARQASDPLIIRLERIFAGFVSSLQAGSPLYLSLCNRDRRSKRAYNRPALDSPSKSTRILSFPGRNIEEALRFTVVLRILSVIFEALTTDIVISKRDIFYKAPSLFGQQAVVDKYVDDIAYTLDVPRDALNVTAAATGLAAGAFTIKDADGNIVVDGLTTTETLIRRITDAETLHVAPVGFVLVVEKEATFRTLTESRFWHEVRHHAIIVTGKGYPDVTTRAFVRRLTTASSENGFLGAPAYCLVDYDPDGLAIFRTYKFGSKAMAHERYHLVSESLRRIGLESVDALKVIQAEGSASVNGLLQLTLRDRWLATGMLNRCDVKFSHSQDSSDLRTMLMLNIKCETQVLDDHPGGLGNWLSERLPRLKAV